MKKLFIAFVALFYIFSVPVFANEEDILKEPIQEDKEIVDDYNSLKDIENVNNTRGVINNPLNAVDIEISLNNTNQGISLSTYINVDNINIGEKYYVELNQIYNGLIIPYNGYFVRGSETLSTKYQYFYNNNIYDNGYISGFYNNKHTNSVYGVAKIYIEPTPEPTPEPTTEPTPEPEEPEVDPETISGNEILREILITNREINENVQGIYKLLSNNSVYDSVLSGNAVSDNIINKRLEDYNTSESLALIGLVLAFGALLVYVIHKSVFKIRR